MQILNGKIHLYINRLPWLALTNADGRVLVTPWCTLALFYSRCLFYSTISRNIKPLANCQAYFGKYFDMLWISFPFIAITFSTYFYIQALIDTTMVRAFLPIPLLILPAMINPSLEKFVYLNYYSVSLISLTFTSEKRFNLSSLDFDG